MQIVTKPRKRFSSQADAELLAALRSIAMQEGRPFQDVLEDAIRAYVLVRVRERQRASVMRHFEASLAKNRQLGKLLVD